MDTILKQEINKCKTPKQVMKILDKYGLKIVKDDSKEVGSFSVWLDDFTRIYKPHYGNMIFQKWRKVDVTYSGIPVFFG